MKLTTERPYADPEKAARRLMQHARAFEPVQDGRIYIEKINAPFLFGDTRVSVFRSSSGEQMPWVSSSLLEDVYFSSISDPDLTTSSIGQNTKTKLAAPK